MRKFTLFMMSLLICTAMLAIKPANAQAATKSTMIPNIGTYEYNTKTKTATLKRPVVDDDYVYVPWGICIQNKSYKVTKIDKNAFKKDTKKIKYVEIDGFIKSVDANTFNLPKAKSIIFIHATNTVFKKHAFKKLNKKCTFDVNCTQMKKNIRKYNKNIKTKQISVSITH